MSKIMVDENDFEHLLNCLANQKYISEQLDETKKEWQEIIDTAWDKGMQELSKHRHTKTLCNAPTILE